MSDNKKIWNLTRDKLVKEVVSLGFPPELGDQIAKNLGSPKAMDRMIAYLQYVKPKKVELVVDEMLAIVTDIEAWREKRAGREANEKYNELLNNGLF